MKKILLVDDNEDILHAVEQVLAYDHYRVKTHSKSAGFMDAVTSFKPDLIVLDYLLGDGNGGDLCILVKSSDQFSRIPVIMMSAYSRGKLDMQEFGCDAVIAKPFDIIELSSTIRRLLTAAAGN